MDQSHFTCAGFKFYSNFDSANIARVEHVPQQQENVDVSCTTNNVSVLEFNVWTKPDCAGTEFENGNRTWFYFGIKAAVAATFVRLNIIDINKQAKMYSQGMAPVFKIVPGKPIWERIRDKLTYSTSNENIFSLSFKYKTPENPEAVVYFAFTYPYSYTDLQHSLRLIDDKYLHAPTLSKDDIYYVHECVCKSVEGRRIDLLTISSYHHISSEREDRLQHLFPDKTTLRPFKFANKKVIFVSARVHPGETPSTFVLNGLLNLLLSRDDPVALVLRRHYVFKLIPFLNPDGVSRGHYRTDISGTNLNRVYLQPTMQQHPSVYAARALLRYHHAGGREMPDPHIQQSQHQPQMQLSDVVTPHVPVNASSAEIVVERDVSTLIETTIVTNDRRLSSMSLTEDTEDTCCAPSPSELPTTTTSAAGTSKEHQLTFCNRLHGGLKNDEMSVMVDDDVGSDGLMTKLNKDQNEHKVGEKGEGDSNDNITAGESGLFLYVDMHGHASKKGIFMYGNHFDNMADSVECMLLPKIMSLNNHNFHFTACNFTERNMYLKDRRDGMSREGSGRVAVLKLTGLVRSYTLECNYNTGRLTNQLPPTVRESNTINNATYTSTVPPKYNPQVFEEVGRALGASILDLTGQNPLTRLPNSEFHSLSGLRQWLMMNCTCSASITLATSPTIIHHHNHPHPHAQQAVDNSAAITHALATPAPPVDGAGAPGAVKARRGGTKALPTASSPSQAGGWRSTGAILFGRNKASRYPHHLHNRAHHYGYVRHHHNHSSGTGHHGNTRSTHAPSTSSHGSHHLSGGGSPSAGVSAPATSTAVTPVGGKRGGKSSMMAAAAAAQVAKQQQQRARAAALLSSSAAAAAAAGVIAAGGGSTSTSRRLKLREICWIKGGSDTGQGKALIAKYTTTTTSAGAVTTSTAATSGLGAAAAAAAAAAAGGAVEDNLIVSWDSNNANPQVFAQRTSIVGHQQQQQQQQQPHSTNTIVGSTASNNRASKSTTVTTTNKRPTFRVHNFRRRQHHPLIALTGAATTVATPTAQQHHSRQRRHQTAATTKPTAITTKIKHGKQSTKQQQSKARKNTKVTVTAAAAATSDGTTVMVPSAAASIDGAASTAAGEHQLQLQQRLQRSRRKRKRNKSGGLLVVHHHHHHHH